MRYYRRDYSNKRFDVSKTVFRKKCLEATNALGSHNKKYRDNKLNNALQKIIKKIPHKNVLMYWPMKQEADIRKTVHTLRKQGNVLLPFMQESSFKMVPFRLPLKSKKFGILESGNSHKNINKTDVAIVPIVGVDSEGRRIGFGKGMYDRFFPSLRNTPIIIFVQTQLCMSNESICDDYDIKADMLVTPKHNYAALRTNNVKRNTFRRWRGHYKRGNRVFYL